MALCSTNYAKAEDTPIIVQGSFGATFNLNDSNNLNGEKDLNNSLENSLTDVADPYANVSFKLDHYPPLATDIFELRITVTSNTLVSGTKGRLKLTTPNLLNPITLYDENLELIFPSSMLHVGTVDYVQISPDISLIKGNYSNCYVYFNKLGWISGVTYYGNIEIIR